MGLRKEELFFGDGSVGIGRAGGELFWVQSG